MSTQNKVGWAVEICKAQSYVLLFASGVGEKVEEAEMRVFAGRSLSAHDIKSGAV